MKQFIIKIAVFVLILVAYTGINYLVNRHIISHSEMPLEAVNVLIAGDSHSKNSVDPGLFNAARNISQTAEPYVVTFWKLKYMLPELPVDTVILGFSHHSISSFNDMKFTDKKWASEMFNRTYPIQNFDGLHHVNVDFTRFYKIYFRNMCLYPNYDHFDYIGEGYSANDFSDVSNSDVVIDRHYFYKGDTVGISATSIAYLDSIINLCERQQVELILVGSPVHESYYENIPPFIKHKYDQLKTRLRNEDIVVIDKIDASYKKEYYLDADHLNEKGAQKFTETIKGNLQ